MAKNEMTEAERYREERKKRLAKAAKKNSKKSISSKSAETAGKIITFIIVAAIVVALGCVVVNQSGIIERSTTAVTVAENTDVSQAEYSFYYTGNYNQYAQYVSYGYVSFDTSTPLSKQTYDNSIGEIEGFPEDKTPTWADFFDYTAKTNIGYIKAAVAAAKEAGIELTDAQKTEIETEIKEFEETAKKSNYSLSAFLKANYGKGMNEKLYRQILEDQKLATAFQEAKTDEYKGAVTGKEINKEYKKNIANYGKISVKYITVDYAKTTTEDGEETVDAGSKKKVDAEIKKLENATSIKEFETLAANLKKAVPEAKEAVVTDAVDESYTNVKGIASSDEGYTSWVSDAGAVEGDVYVSCGESSASAVIMVEASHKAPDAPVYDSRHILVNFTEEEAEEVADSAEEAETIEDAETVEDAEVADSEDAAETTEETTEATTEAKKDEVKIKELDLSKADKLVIDNKVDAQSAANKDAYAKIQDVLQEYIDGSHDEAAFAALAHEYSEDTGSNENGGLYEGTAKGEFVPPYESWCLADGRKEGDVGIVEYQGDNYKGYHLIYFVKQWTKTWKDDVIDALASTKYNEFAEKLQTGDSAKITSTNDNAVTKVVSNLDKLISRNARNSAAQAQNAAY